MFSLNSKYEEVKVYAETIEQEAISQITQIINSPLGEDAHIRIMPDAHAGAGCVIGTTMVITDKVCPNIVGVDIGCGVDLIKTDIDFSARLDELDEVIRKYIPFGMDTHIEEKSWDFERLICWEHLDSDTKVRAKTALGTLGGGNHFIEAYDGGWLAVHSGSRNIGYRVADYYQKLAEKSIKEQNYRIMKEQLQSIEPTQREKWIVDHKIKVDRDLCYLTDDNMVDYLHDIKIMQEFANDNRITMLSTIVEAMGGNWWSHINSIHNYIDTDNMILRKGAISAQKDQQLVIPLNMRDGLLICKGKGNPDWNYSAPHGAGRLMSRAKAKETISLDEFSDSMKDVYSTTVCQATIDESPFAYKDMEEIMKAIEPTVEIIDRIVPIYNFKATD